MTEAKLLGLRTLCRICNDGKRYRYLGSHIAQAHGATAREYKKEMGIFLKIPLTDPDLESLQREKNLQTLDMKKFLENGQGTRFEKDERRDRYVSKQYSETLAARNKKRGLEIQLRKDFKDGQ